MSWHYQIRKRIVNGKKEFDIVERYIKPDKGWTKKSIAAFGESKKEVVWVLKMMLKDAKKYPVIRDI